MKETVIKCNIVFRTALLLIRFLKYTLLSFVSVCLYMLFYVGYYFFITPRCEHVLQTNRCTAVYENLRVLMQKSLRFGNFLKFYSELEFLVIHPTD